MNLTTSLVVLSTVTLFVACGGESEQSLDDYFADLEKALDTFIDETDVVAVEEGFLVNFEDVSATVSGFQRFLPAMAEATQHFVDELETLRPPAEAAGGHRRVVETLDAFIASTSLIAAELEGVTTADALKPVYQRYAETGNNISAACLKLQGVADEYGVTVSLHC